MYVVVFVVMFVVLVVGAAWVGQGNQFFLYQFFAPKFEQVRRDTFEQSKAYNQGMVQELQNMQFDYVRADDAHKEALGNIILHRAADYDVSKMPPDLAQFVTGLRSDRIRIVP